MKSRHHSKTTKKTTTVALALTRNTVIDFQPSHVDFILVMRLPELLFAVGYAIPSWLYRFFRLTGHVAYMERYRKQESFKTVRGSQRPCTYIVIKAVTLIRSTPRSRPNKVGVKCPSARPYVRPSIPKSFFDFNEIRRVGRGRRVMHDGMQYDPIQGQGQGHEPLKVGNSAIFKRLSPPPFIMGAGK